MESSKEERLSRSFCVQIVYWGETKAGRFLLYDPSDDLVSLREVILQLHLKSCLYNRNIMLLRLSSILSFGSMEGLCERWDI